MRRETVSSAEETQKLGEALGKVLPPQSVVALEGDLGAGKTTFVKGLVGGATGVSPIDVNSPTFTYLHTYEGSKTIYHFDLYRLKNPLNFIEMGFDEFFHRGICCIEWAERIQEILPKDTLFIHISITGKTSRTLTFSK